LRGNECINEDFDGETRIARLQQVVTIKCAFTETPEQIAKLDEKFKSLEIFMQRQIETLRTENQEKAKQIEKLGAEVKQKSDELLIRTANDAGLQSSIVRLEAELKAANVIQNLCKQLDAQRNQTFIAMTKDLRETVDFKVNEIRDLSDDLQKKNAEINEKTAKIKQLEGTVDSLSSNGPY
jgi:chromosome segregation ATPase